VSGVNFLVGVLIARFLGVEQFGFFTLLWMAVLFIQSLQMSMISAPMMSIGPKQNNQEKIGYYRAVIAHQSIFSIASSVFLCISIIIGNKIFPAWNIIEFVFVLPLTLFLSQNQDFIRRLFFVEKRFLAAFYNDLIGYGGRLLGLFVLFSVTEPSLDTVLWVISITLSVSVGLGFLMIHKPSFDYQHILKVFQRHWKMSKWLTGTALMQWTSGNYFIVVAGALSGPVAVGVLRAAGNIIGITNILFQGLENIVPPTASRHLVLSGIAGLKSYLRKVFIFGGAAVLALAILLSIFSGQILTLLYGNEYSDYGYILVWYSMISIISYSLIPLFIGLRTLENTKPLFISYLITTIFSISTANILIEKFELNGVMTGMLMNSLIMLFVSYVYFLKTCSLRTIDENESVSPDM